MDPPYQRGYVWDNNDKEYLLESVFLNVDIGKFALVERAEWKTGEPVYEILDGKQRLSTLVDFFEGRIQYHGYFYYDLSARDKNSFLEHTISCATIRNASEKEILRYFLHLNRGGRKMKKEDLERVEKTYASLTDG